LYKNLNLFVKNLFIQYIEKIDHALDIFQNMKRTINKIYLIALKNVEKSYLKIF